MAKKNLQLSEIKIKSFVTLVDKDEQRTAKGGYVYNDRLDAIIIDIGSKPSWTELKTRVTNGDDVMHLGGGRK